jgi:hypothetical protein
MEFFFTSGYLFYKLVKQTCAESKKNSLLGGVAWCDRKMTSDDQKYTQCPNCNKEYVKPWFIRGTLLCTNCWDQKMWNNFDKTICQYCSIPTFGEEIIKGGGQRFCSQDHKMKYKDGKNTRGWRRVARDNC